MSAGNGELISVRIGGLEAGQAGVTFRTLLGSCIGLAMYDRSARVGGLAHIVLPDSVGHEGPPGKFVETAVPELIRQIENLGGKRRNLRAKLSGGANMFSSDAPKTIGDRNLEAIQQALAERGVPVMATHCGGTQGRRMTFDPATGAVRIEIVGREIIEL